MKLTLKHNNRYHWLENTTLTNFYLYKCLHKAGLKKEVHILTLVDILLQVYINGYLFNKEGDLFIGIENGAIKWDTNKLNNIKLDHLKAKGYIMQAINPDTEDIIYF